ncbi:4-hydroxy-tetrahydrodipicolinate synthase [Candidatus Avoscillospira sp. LCP25S3_F1]|uniref:4-hydroxy-tetrahydrodipicolinate synthase n=1 Tax=Candidatus Avoscillospira sp. LCP25S3_F1 TaxID=3438825 RepID=UPI003F8E6B4A
MNHEPIFRGVATALITPTDETGIDFAAFKKLINWQIDEGINALVICGTTGEGSTLSDQEHRDALSCAVETAAGRVPIIAGTGSNDTSYAIELTKFACSIGCDGMLCVTPYYNKATQKGLVAMYNAIGDASTKPIILYNVPSRTGVNIEPATYVELAKHPMIAGIKEANGNISKIVETAALVGGQLAIYSGNDDEIVPIMACGGIGVISVLSNVAPRETVAICDKFFAGDVAGAMALQAKYLPLIRALFSEVNPIPVKAAMAAMGFCKDYLRLPLTPMEEGHKATMLQAMRDVGINV